MATAAFTSEVKKLTNAPFLIKSFTYTGGATTSATAITHGEVRAPDIVFGIATTNTSTSGALIGDTIGATSLKIATSTDAAGAGTAYLVWFEQNGGAGLDPA